MLTTGTARFCRRVDLSTGEQLKPEFLALNPQHTVPTLVDEGRALWDSHAIATYLIGKYGGAKDGDHPLYPRDLYTRASIDQRLQLDTAVAFPAIHNIVNSIYFTGASEPSGEQRTAAHSFYGLLETLLADDPYVVGGQLTVADLSLISTVSTLRTLVPVAPADKYPKLLAWIRRLEDVPHFHEAIAVNVAEFEGFLAKIQQKNKAAAVQKAAKV